MSKFERFIQITREEGFFEALNRGLIFGANQLPGCIWSPFIIYSLYKDGREIQDIKYLLDNSRDRHDALVGPNLLYSYSSYPGLRTRALHYYRYVLATNLLIGTEPDRVLDIAAGVSYGTHILKAKLNSDFEYIAGDISADALVYGQKYYSPESSVQADAHHLPLDGDSTDIVLSFETMEHIPNVDKYLTELNRIVRPNGELFISVPNDEDIDSKGDHDVKKYPHVHVFDYEKFRNKLNSHFPERSLTIYAQERPERVIRPGEILDLPPGFIELDGECEITEQTTLLAHVN
ncbi:class I SAM-dependent methyltransferase [Halobaculum roseum]|uniref:Class I SAM-dependent methyltransferase n=1 Tax=Halobaculum roseum TaxID=2175149 RepID=A0ABD5MLN2_9EURY|nr:class I SAM-dependent methyltransferase [Halobaculum roseum]QZY03250.1 class I SAM-dependent methyltransferase [Halobaculum roseum]